MAYNNYGYSNYSQYYAAQQQDQGQNQTQQSGSNAQAYQNPYSPYYQSTGQFTPQSSERGQQYQAKQAIDTSNYQQNIYSQNQYQPNSRPDNPSSYSQSQAYQPTTQTSTSNYGYATPNATDQQGSRLYTDNSALGSLAYASTLGRNSPVTGQSQPSSRQQSALPAYQMQQSNDQYQQSPQMPQESMVQPKRTKTPASYATSRESALQQQVQQPSPKLATQPQQRSNTSTLAQQTRSPSVPQQGRAGQQQSSRAAATSDRAKGNSQPASATTRKGAKSKGANAHQISTIMNQNEPQGGQQQQAPASHGRGLAYGAPTQDSNLVVATTPTLVESQPTTIDPSQIFDQAEYQRRRKAAEEVEAVNRAKKQTSQSSTIQQPQPTQLQQHQQQPQPQLQQSPQVAQLQNLNQDMNKHARNDSQSREQIQAEMKEMVEKMRKYKAEDPSGFSEIWEQFKKVQPPQKVASQTPQTSKGNATTSGFAATNDSSIISPIMDNQPFPSPLLDSTFESISTPAGNMPDIGKFPAMRRKTRNDKGVTRSSKGGSGTSPPAADPAIVPAKAPSKPTTKPTSKTAGKPPSQQPVQPPSNTPQASSADAGAESMRRAMQAFHNTPTPTPSSQQSSPPAQSPQPTIWPEREKPLLADVAKKFLERLEANKGKSISTGEIIMMLNQNPSYDQFCGMLNSRGFQFVRRPFAKTLLSVVPSNADSTSNAASKRGGKSRKDAAVPSLDANGVITQSPQVNPQNVRWHTNLTQAAAPSQKKKTNKSAKASSPNSSAITQGLTMMGSPTNVAPEYKSYYERMRMISVGSPSASSPPLSKQQAARKRNFNEIVDLSQVSDDDDTQAKRLQTQRLGGEYAGLDQSEIPIPIDPNLEPAMEQPYGITAEPSIDGQESQFDNFRNDDSGGFLRNENLRNANLVKAINSHEALRHRPVNVSTLARDILISRGEHPRERPLNFHLRDLAMNFRTVTTKSDLSTFRWDLVDPVPEGTVLPSEQEQSDTEDDDRLIKDEFTVESNRIDAAAQSQESKSYNSILKRGSGRGRPRGRPRVRGMIFGARHVDIKDKNNIDPSKPSRGGLVSRGRSRARGASRTSQVPPQLPASVNTPANFVSLNNGAAPAQNFDTFHQTQDAQNSQARSSNHPLPSADPMNLDSPSDTQDESQDEGIVQESPRRNMMVAASADVLRTPTNFVGQSPNVSSPKSHHASFQSLNPVQQAQKKRGRPPKRQGQGQGSLGSSRSITPNKISPGTPNDSGPKKRGRPLGSKNSPWAMKPGRPSKLQKQVRPALPDDGIGVNIPAASPLFRELPISHVEPPPKRQKKSWKTSNQYAEEDPDPDEFTFFPCSWADCGVQLHNLATLKKHVRNIHISQPPKSIDGALHCLWKGCPQTKFDFGDMANLDEHIDEKHMAALASSLGDGPSTHPAVVDPSVYLFNDKGEQVTPFATAIGKPDPLPLRAGQGPTKAYHKAHGNITQEQKDRALKESMAIHVERGNIPEGFLMESSSEEEEEEDKAESNNNNADVDDPSTDEETLLQRFGIALPKPAESGSIDDETAENEESDMEQREAKSTIYVKAAPPHRATIEISDSEAYYGEFP